MALDAADRVCNLQTGHAVMSCRSADWRNDPIVQTACVGVEDIGTRCDQSATPAMCLAQT